MAFVSCRFFPSLWHNIEKARFLDKTDTVLLQGHFKEFILVFYNAAIMLAAEHPSFLAFQLSATQETGKPTTTALLSRVLRGRDGMHSVVLWQQGGRSSFLKSHRQKDFKSTNHKINGAILGQGELFCMSFSKK